MRIEQDIDGQVIINVDDRELSLKEFGTLLAAYAGWGMRIDFTPRGATERWRRQKVRDPEEPYPSLRPSDLAAAYVYADAHRDEIEAAIRRNEEEEEGVEG